MRKDPTAAVPEFDAPRQRLATTKPRAGSNSQVDADAYNAAIREGQPTAQQQHPLAGNERAIPSQPPNQPGQNEIATVSMTDTTPAADQTAYRTHGPTHPDAANSPSKESAVTATLGDRAPTAPRTRASDKPIRSIAVAPAKSQQTNASKAAVARASANRIELPKDATQADLLKAFRDSPPEVKEQAMRQLVAALSRTADATDQPGALGDALVNSLDKLPELPPETKVPPTTPPNRLASQNTTGVGEPTNRALPSPDRAVESNDTTTVAKAKPTTESISGTPEPSDSKLEPAIVQSIPASAEASGMTDETAVRPASAARDGARDALVTQATISPETSGSVETTGSPEATVQGMPKPNSANLSDQELYDALLTRLSEAPADETEAERSRRLIMARHLMVLAGDPDRAVAEIEDMSDKEQEYLRHQLLGLWTIIDPEGHPVPARRFTTALPQLREATKYLAAATDSLEVRSLAFCTEIEAYGQIKTFPGNRFESGQQVILYCEIENFTVSTVDGGFETNLQGSYDIFNSENEKVVSQLLPADKQISSNYLRDYFIAYQMHLPKQLSKGSYRLQLTMEDVAGKKYGQASLPLEIK